MCVDDPKKASLVGLRISDEASQPDFYCINIYNMASDYYVCVNERLLIIKDACLAPAVGALLLGAEGIFNDVPTEPDLICDLPETLRLLTQENVDNHAVILNFLNADLDVVGQLGCGITEWAKRDLYKVADHLTFNREFSSFLLAENIGRDELSDAICLCVGMVIPRILFVDERCLSLYPWGPTPTSDPIDS
jgi:hypothetical protein